MYGPANAYAEVADCGSGDLGFLSSDDCLFTFPVFCALPERESDQSPDTQQLAEFCRISENQLLITFQW
jgi:hypothetical protein